MRWLKKFTGTNQTPTKVQLVYEGKAATATRAMIAENRHFPVLELTFILRNRSEDPRSKELVDEVKIYLDLEDANKFANQLLASIQAATPRLPRGASSGPWGE